MNAAIGLVRVAKCGMFMLYFCAVLGECVSNGCHQLTFVVACAEVLLGGVHSVTLFLYSPSPVHGGEGLAR